MTRTWLESDPGMDVPSLRELIDSWQELEWMQVPLDEAPLAPLFDELRRTHAGVLAARFRATSFNEVTRWYLARDQFEYYELFRTLFASDTFRAALPEFQVPDELPRNPGGLARADIMALDALLARWVVCGGAYLGWKGSLREARALVEPVADALRPGAWEEVRVDLTEEPWTPWFRDIAWDMTLLVTDRRACEVTIICATDLD